MSSKTKKVLQYICWALVGLGTVGLILLGCTAEEVSGGIVVIDGVIIAISAAVAYILGKIKS